jgi:hypothetical protein
VANIKFTNADGTDEYRQALGAGTVGDPYRGTSLIQAADDVDSDNPLHVQSAEVQARLGDTDESAAGSDTATSGLNGLIKRVLARLTTLINDLASRPLGTEAAPVAVRGKARPFRITPTLTAGGAGYAQNDCMGGLIEIADAVPAAGRTLLLHSIQVNIRKTASISSLSFLQLIVFDANPAASTLTNDNAVNINFDDDGKVAAVFNIDAGNLLDSTTLSANQASTAPLPKAIAPVTGTSIWIALRQAGSGTAIIHDNANDLKLTLIGYDE